MPFGRALRIGKARKPRDRARACRRRTLSRGCAGQPGVGAGALVRAIGVRNATARNDRANARGVRALRIALAQRSAAGAVTFRWALCVAEPHVAVAGAVSLEHRTITVHLAESAAYVALARLRTIAGNEARLVRDGAGPGLRRAVAAHVAGDMRDA